MDRYGVMGYPIAHSQSPFIHTEFARQTGEAIEYRAILVEPGGLPAAVRAFAGEGGRGLNITLPFKAEARRLADDISPRGERAGVVNTLRFDAGGGVFGDNTDGVGLTRDLARNWRVAIAGRRVLLLGAGGAARGVAGPLLDEKPAVLVVANRTRSRAEALARAFADQGPLRVRGFDELAGERFEILINATSASLEDAIPPVPASLLGREVCCYDIMYAAEPTPFAAWCARHGAGLAVDGLGMLVEQAAESFYLWRGVRPETGPVLAALRARLSSSVPAGDSG